MDPKLGYIPNAPPLSGPARAERIILKIETSFDPNEHSSGFFKETLKGAAIVGASGAGAVGLVGGGLAVAGFSSGGVVAGSLAAATQATIGNVAAGSIFAACQSAGALGLSSLIVPVGVPAAIFGGAGYGVYKAWKWWNSEPAKPTKPTGES